MINKKKVALTAALVFVLLFGGLFVGSKIGANSSWTSEIATFANQQINAAGHAKKEELKNSDITEQMKLMLDPKIAEEQAELERLLEEYYKMKLAGLESSPEFKKLEADIEVIRKNSYNRYVKEIDLLFAK